jgi:hypothetical protein
MEQLMQRISIIICFFLLSGCALFGQHQSRHHKTTSLVNFLYPDGAVPQDVLLIGLSVMAKQRNKHGIIAC